MNVKKEKSFLPAELLRVRDRQTKNSGGEQRHRGPGPYKACNTKPQNASLHIHIANIDPSYCNTFSLSLSLSPSPRAIISCCSHLIICSLSLCTDVSCISVSSLLSFCREEATN